LILKADLFVASAEFPRSWIELERPEAKTAGW
jgi:hypothetical protein